jgi:hypothetical protein
MQILIAKRSMVLFMGIAFIFTVGTAPLAAQEMTKISGKMTLAAEMQNMVEIGDTEGHTFNFSVFEGTNSSTGTRKFMDGANVVNVAVSDLVKGNGTHQTYATISKKDDAIIAKCQGKNVAKMSAEGESMMTFEGTFTYVGGKGRYKNIQGKGTYKGKYISKKIYVVEWEGEYVIKK